MPRKYKNPKKPNVISVRIADDEMENIQQLMGAMNKSASDLMRDAVAMLMAQWEMSRSAESFVKN